MIDLYLDYLKGIDLEGLDTSRMRLSFLAQGEYNQNYLLESAGRRLVFRINFGSQIGREDQILYEYRALKRLEASGCTPRAYYADDSRQVIPQGLLIMEYLEGRPLDYACDLPRAAEIFRRIHSLPLEESDEHTFIQEPCLLCSRLDESRLLLGKVWTSPLISSEVKTIFERLISRLNVAASQEAFFEEHPRRALCNTEVNSHNFIIGEEGSWLIDWEKPVISDPVQDICQFLAPTTTLWRRNVRLSPGEVDIFFKNYGDDDLYMRDRVRIYAPYMALRALSWCAMAYLEYQNPEKSLANPDIYRKICDYLAPDFMKKLLRELL